MTIKSVVVNVGFNMLHHLCHFPSIICFPAKAILFLTDGEPNGENNVILEKLAKLNAQLNNEVIILTFGVGEGRLHISNVLQSRKTNKN